MSENMKVFLVVAPVVAVVAVAVLINQVVFKLGMNALPIEIGLAVATWLVMRRFVVKRL